jgi:predicted dehydrogenase
LSATAAAASAELADGLRLPLSPYQNRRWDGDFRTVRSLVEGGSLGDILRFESRFERFKPDSGPAPSGGGTLLELGSHLVDQALVLLGQVQSVYAEWTIRHNGFDDDVFVALGHVDGGDSHLWASSMQAAPGPRFRVSGTRAAYVIDRPLDGQEAALVAGRSPATEGADWGREPAETWGRLVRGDEHELIETLPGAWDDFYAEFAGAVRGDGPLPVTALEAIETARVLDAAAASATGGELVWFADRPGIGPRAQPGSGSGP